MSTDTLRALLDRPGLLRLPGVYDGLSARLAERAGFPAAYVTGFGAAASRLGMPDLGLMSFKEMLDHVAALADAVAIPLVADADTGYGGARNVARTVRAFAKAGAAAVQIEDQAWPKRCGHTEGKRVVPREEAVDRVKAAVDAAAGRALVVARTDARATDGIEEALARGRAFAGAGADLVFVEAPRSREELARVGREAAPQVVNVLEGGATPVLTPEEYAAFGFRVAIYPLTLLYAAARAVRDRLAAFEPWDGPLDFTELRDTLGWFTEP